MTPCCLSVGGHHPAWIVWPVFTALIAFLAGVGIGYNSGREEEARRQEEASPEDLD